MLFFFGRNWHCFLLMWKMSKTLAEYRKVGQGELWRLCNSRLRHPKRTSPVVPNMELLYGNKCTTKPKRCCRKLVNSSMVDTKPFWKDGTKMTNTAILCQKLGGLTSRLFSMKNLHWKITPILQQEGKEIVMRKGGYSSWIKKVIKDQWINDLVSLQQNEKWKDCMMNMWKRLQKEIHPFILYNDQDNEDTNNLKGLKNIITKYRFEVKGKLVAESNTFVLVKSVESLNSWRSSSWTDR